MRAQAERDQAATVERLRQTTAAARELEAKREAAAGAAAAEDRKRQEAQMRASAAEAEAARLQQQRCGKARGVLGRHQAWED